METGSGDVCTLPEGCISHVISLTSPADSCRSMAVCTTFRSAAVSDTVWERFLLPDYQSILSRAVHPVEYSSKKELFFRLCEPILIDDGKMSFSLDKSSGAKCYMLSARQLFIVWGDTPHYWTWHPLPDSRFSEVAELINVCWLELGGMIQSRVLTPKTIYAAYLIFKVDQNSRGLGFPNQETTVKLGSQVSKHTVNIQPIAAKRRRTRWCMLNLIWGATGEGHADAEENQIAARAPQARDDDWMVMGECYDDDGEEGHADAEENQIAARTPQARADGWMEMEMGEFYNDDGEDGEVELSLMEVKGGNWKSGLTIQGIEIRPKK